MTIAILDPLSGKLVTIAKPRPKFAGPELPDASAHRMRHGTKVTASGFIGALQGKQSSTTNRCSDGRFACLPALKELRREF